MRTAYEGRLTVLSVLALRRTSVNTDTAWKMKFLVSIVGALLLVAQASAQAVRAHIVSCSG